MGEGNNGRKICENFMVGGSSPSSDRLFCGGDPPLVPYGAAGGSPGDEESDRPDQPAGGGTRGAGSAILAWRQEKGGFSAVEELLEVKGIGEATLERLRPYVTVGVPAVEKGGDHGTDSGG